MHTCSVSNVKPTEYSVKTCTCNVLFDTLGLSACTYNTTWDDKITLPDNTTSNNTRLYVTLYIADSSGGYAWATRTLVLLRPCDTGEMRCADGTCANVCSDSSAELATDSKTPKISLNTHVAVSSSVKVKQGSRYVECTNRIRPSESVPCELGAQAYDAEGANITSKVQG